MSANALPSGIALLVIASVALLFTVGVVLWHRFGPTNRTLRNLLGGLSPQFARLITADYAEQVLGAETDPALAQLASLGLATSRAYALGRATAGELHAVTRALSRAYGPDFVKIAGLSTVEGAVPPSEPDLVDLARRLGIFGFPADVDGGIAVTSTDEKLHLSVTAGAAGPFVGKAVACACAEEPKPFLAAQYARGGVEDQAGRRPAPGGPAQRGSSPRRRHVVCAVPAEHDRRCRLSGRTDRLSDRAGRSLRLQRPSGDRIAQPGQRPVRAGPAKPGRAKPAGATPSRAGRAKPTRPSELDILP